MATIDKDSSSPANPNTSTSLHESSGNYYYTEKLKTLGEETAIPWIDYAVQQAQLAQSTVESAMKNAITSTRYRLDRFWTTGSAHFNQTRASLQDVKSDYSVYEDIVLGKIKEGIHLGGAHPLIATGSLAGLGLLGLKRPRRFLYYKMVLLFVSEEVLLSRADVKVKALQQSVELLRAESAKLEKAALQAQEEMTRGRTKLRQAGKQIQSVISSGYKIKRQAEGLKDVLRELPRREVSRFRSQYLLNGQPKIACNE